MINRLISFELCGRFAHFRKFYTNSSSLTYLLPPKTVITGLLASILQKPRDSYYDLFKEENTKIAIALNSKVKKQMQSMNYLHDKFHDYLTKGGETKYHHSQCKLELLSGVDNSFIKYQVYVWHSTIFGDLLSAITENRLGYGIYFGQRQFSAFIQNVQVIDSFKRVENSTYLDSAILKENIISLGLNETCHIISELMPSSMKPEFEEIKENKNKKRTAESDVNKTTKIIGREPVKTCTVFFESTGQRITGQFKNCWQADDKVISFY
ncbi:MAG: CRISPR-associated protein Cas5 [Candidatus Nanoarchaeia archaeon]|nr:CRISPR-associated protein Cas5 [Candidatus Nanoarchaeia archaeon]